MLHATYCLVVLGFASWFTNHEALAPIFAPRIFVLIVSNTQLSIGEHSLVQSRQKERKAREKQAAALVLDIRCKIEGTDPVTLLWFCLDGLFLLYILWGMLYFFINPSSILLFKGCATCEIHSFCILVFDVWTRPWFQIIDADFYKADS